MNFVNCITITTDASFCPETKSSGYAFQIVCNKFKIIRSGNFKKNPENSTDAETMCIANALHTLEKRKDLPFTKLIVVNCDCLTSIEKIKLKSNNEPGRKAAQILRKIRLKTEMPKYEFRHVKAHSKEKDARSYVNEWCDKEAKKWMREQRNNIKNGAHIKTV